MTAFRGHRATAAGRAAADAAVQRLADLGAVPLPDAARRLGVRYDELRDQLNQMPDSPQVIVRVDGRKFRGVLTSWLLEVQS